jgi:hypothetical protein
MAITPQGHIIIKNARISFPNLFKEDRKGDQVFSRGAKLILDKEENADAIAEIKAEINRIAKEFPKIGAVALKKEDKRCLRDSDREEYGDAMVLSANNKGKILVLDKSRQETTDENLIYSGCRVNAKVEIWGQDNDFGKRINSKLIAVQFAKDDKAFDGSHVSAEVAADGFEELDADGFEELDDDMDL